VRISIPTNATQSQHRQRLSTGSIRSNVIATLILLSWAVLIGRLIQLQGSQRARLDERVTRQRTFTEPVSARPGEILDRNGHVLAMTVTRDSVYAVPAEITDPWSFAWTVSSALQLNADEVFESLVEDDSRQFVWLRRRATDEQLSAFRRLQLPMQTWGLRREYLRQYPQGSFAAHVLGIRDIDNIGHGGLEESFDQRIRGTDGSRVMTRDALGVVVEVAAENSRAPVHGRSVIASLDLLTQIHVERQLDGLMRTWLPVGACAIVMNPMNGEILAMASRPAFDPNNLQRILDAGWTNLCVSAAFEPGSTFKPFVVGRALELGAVSRDEKIDCGNGSLRMGNRILHDHHPYGQLSVEDILVKSSNVGMAQIARRLGRNQLYDAVVSFGFGRRTGIELPAEAAGLLRPLARWDDYSLGSIPMGHELAVTPCQLITAHAALANGGQWMRPQVLLSSGSHNTAPAPLLNIRTVDAPSPIESRVLKREYAEWLVRGPMRQVIKRGTGKSARVAGLDVFGKTGTAQKFDSDAGTYSHSQSVLSFVCGTPAEHPQVLVLVMVDAPSVGTNHAGGTVAAPAASRILQFVAARMNKLQRKATQ
jgi:cell division protein FtsI (penicillin-binding protein 3)